MNISSITRQLGIHDLLEPAHSAGTSWRWNRRGRPVPAPSAVKRRVLRDYAREYGLSTLVETGTYRGDTVRAMRRHFERIYSIELLPQLHASAVRRCRNQGNASILLGDSGILVRQVLDQLDRPALFWLDAHYSGEGTALGPDVSPIASELHPILGHSTPGHVVLIDDAREFRNAGTTGYPPPSLIEETAVTYGYTLREEFDIFRLTPSA